MPSLTVPGAQTALSTQPSFHPHTFSICLIYLDVFCRLPTHSHIFLISFTYAVFTPLLLLIITSQPSCLFIHLCPTHIHLFLFFSFHSVVSLTLCPCVLNWSMSVDSLKYLVWNLLCNNSRPVPCKTGKIVNPNSKFQMLKKKQTIKDIFAAFEKWIIVTDGVSSVHAACNPWKASTSVYLIDLWACGTWVLTLELAFVLWPTMLVSS